jgi:hypothetical protein
MKAVAIIIMISFMSACNNSVDSDKANTDSSIMSKDSSGKVQADTGTNMMTDTSKSSADTVVKK